MARRIVTVQASCLMPKNHLVEYKQIAERMKLPLKIYVCMDLFYQQGETLLEVVTLYRKEDEEYYNLAIKYSEELWQRKDEKLLCALEG